MGSPGNESGLNEHPASVIISSPNNNSDSKHSIWSQHRMNNFFMTIFPFFSHCKQGPVKIKIGNSGNSIMQTTYHQRLETPVTGGVPVGFVITL